MQPNHAMQPSHGARPAGPVDLTEAYAVLRRRRAAVVRRRIIVAIGAALVLAAGGLAAGGLAGAAHRVGGGRPATSAGPTTVYFADGTTVMARLAGPGRAATAGVGSGPTGPSGLIVAHALAELRRSAAFAGPSAARLDGGGLTIVTTVDARAQALLERTADETVDGSVMFGQTGNLQAAAVVVQPGTGRVLAYFGGHDGTGPDYAAVSDGATADAVRTGAHPPAQTMAGYVLAAALAAGISVRSVWDSPPSKQFPASGRGGANPVRDFNRAPCQPRCTLAEAAAGSLNVPLFGLAERLGVAAMLDAAAWAGVTAMWLPGPGGGARRVDPTDRSDRAGVGVDLGLGRYPITVLDHANGMATLAADGRPAEVHFVREVVADGRPVYREWPPGPGRPRLLGPAAIDQLGWALSRNPAGRLPDGRSTRALTGEWPLGTSLVDTSDAWAVGFTSDLAMAVWVGNEEFELPLRDPTGARVAGSGLPAEIYRGFLAAAPGPLGLGRVEFGTPVLTGDASRGPAG